MFFTKKSFRLLGVLAGAALMGTVLAGCGGQQAGSSDTIKIGANFEMTGNVAKSTRRGASTARSWKLFPLITSPRRLRP